MLLRAGPPRAVHALFACSPCARLATALLPVPRPQPGSGGSKGSGRARQPVTRASLVQVRSRGWSSSEEANEDFAPPRDRQIEAAKASALTSLNYRPHCRAELGKKLVDKGHDPQLVEEALNQLQEVDLVDDESYAEAYARGKWRKNRWAPSRISMALRHKGVSAEAAEEGLRHVFGANARNAHRSLDEEVLASEELLSAQATPELLMGELETALRRQAALSRGLPPETRRRRLAHWLQRRGHTWATISRLLQRLAV